MNNSDYKRQLLKDAAIFTVLSGLLISLPLTKDAWATPDTEVRKSVAQDKEFIREAFPVVSSWEFDDARPYFAKKTIEAASDNFEDVFNALSVSLGELESFEEPSLSPLDSNFEFTAKASSQLTTYEFTAVYELGTADVAIVLVDDLKGREIYAVNIETI